jgi:uncharacterized protein
MPTVEQAQTWYSQSDPVHGFDHVLRVTHLAERLARAEMADLEIVRAAALLHDAVGAEPAGESNRSDHHETSARFAQSILEAEGWPPEQIEAVLHCIRAHRYRSTEAPQTLEARVLFDADKLDVLGAFGIARTIAYAVQAGQPIYAKPSEKFLTTGQTIPGEAHSSYHEFLFKLRHVRARLYTKTARSIADERHEFLVRFYQQLVAEEAGER